MGTSSLQGLCVGAKDTTVSPNERVTLLNFVKRIQRFILLLQQMQQVGRRIKC